MQKQALEYINEVTYPSLRVLGKGKVPLMVWCTCHHQTPLPTSGVCLRPLRGAPLVHHFPPALAFTGHPNWRHLHVNMHLSYKNTVSVLNLRKKQYLPACIALWSASRFLRGLCRSSLPRRQLCIAIQPGYAPCSACPSRACSRLCERASRPSPRIPRHICRNPAYKHYVCSHYFKDVIGMRCIEQDSAGKAYPQLFHNPLRLVVEFPAFPISCIGGRGVVLERVGRLHPSCPVHQAGEVFPTQKTQDSTGKAFVITCSHNLPSPVQVINEKILVCILPC